MMVAGLQDFTSCWKGLIGDLAGPGISSPDVTGSVEQAAQRGRGLRRRTDSGSYVLHLVDLFLEPLSS